MVHVLVYLLRLREGFKLPLLFRTLGREYTAEFKHFDNDSFFFPFRFDHLKLKIELRINILNFKPNKTFTPELYTHAYAVDLCSTPKSFALLG